MGTACIFGAHSAHGATHVTVPFQVSLYRLGHATERLEYAVHVVRQSSLADRRCVAWPGLALRVPSHGGHHPPIRLGLQHVELRAGTGTGTGTGTVTHMQHLKLTDSQPDGMTDCDVYQASEQGREGQQQTAARCCDTGNGSSRRQSTPVAPPHPKSPHTSFVGS